MNSLEMVEENAKTASEATIGAFTKEDFALIERVKAEINANQKIGCTGCRYCMPCPKGVDIPGIFAAYNRRYSDGKLRGLIDYFMCTSVRKEKTCASNCVKCGKCETHCPQGIEIRKELENAKKAFEGPLYHIGKKIVGWFMKY